MPGFVYFPVFPEYRFSPLLVVLCITTRKWIMRIKNGSAGPVVGTCGWCCRRGSRPVMVGVVALFAECLFHVFRRVGEREFVSILGVLEHEGEALVLLYAHLCDVLEVAFAQCG